MKREAGPGVRSSRWSVSRPWMRVFLVMAVLTVVLVVALAAFAQARQGDPALEPLTQEQVDSMVAHVDQHEVVGGQVVVAFKSGVSHTSLQQAAASHGASVQKMLAVSSRLSGQKVAVIHSRSQSVEDLVEKFKNDPTVAMVSPNYRESILEDGVAGENEIFDYLYPTDPGDPLFKQLWGLHNWGQTGGTTDADIDAVEAWETSTGSPTVVVADIDTGVDYTHVDLAANMWTNPGETPGNGVDDDGNGYTDDYYGIDTCYQDSDPMDDNGHGTHTSGTIAAVGDNNLGVTGVGWSTKVMALKFLSAEGGGSDAGAIEAIYYVIDQKVNHGVNVVAINASWGGGGYNPVLEEAISDAGDAGIIFVAAAGNSNANVDSTPFYPCCYDLPNIVSVGATDHNDNRADFSNYGAKNVDLFAPGVGILSTVPGLRYEAQEGDFFYDGMEEGAANWTVEGSAAWGITTEWPYSGSRSWSDSPWGDYALNVNGSIVTRTFDLTAGVPDPVFWCVINYSLEEGWDCLYLEFSGDGGETWDHQASFTGSSNGWGGYGRWIDEYLRTTDFKARFRLVSDDMNTADGVYIDEVGIDTVSVSNSFALYSGTSMAAPHVAGAIGVLAAQYPGETALARINRVRSGVDVLPQLNGLANTGGRLNLAASIDPGLVLQPWITDLSPRTAVVPGTTVLTVDGHFFGSSTGRLILSDGVSEIDASVNSWSDTHIEATLPETMNATVIVERADGARAIAGVLSAWVGKEPSMLSRDGNAAAYLDGRIYSFGGYTSSGITDVGEYYDIATDSWVASSKLRLPEARTYPAAAVLDGLVYVMGGYNYDLADPVSGRVRAYNPSSGTWQDAAPLPSPLFQHEAVALDGKLWVFGGVMRIGAYYYWNTTMFVYEPTTNSWSTRPGPSMPRQEAAGVTLGGKIYLFGGSYGGPQNRTEIYDPVTGAWSTGPDMPIPLARMGAAEHDGMAYLIGGTGADYDETSSVLRFDPSSNQWTDLSATIAALPEGVDSSPAVGVEGRGLYSMNGYTFNSGSSNRLVFLPDSLVATKTIYGRVLDYSGATLAGATVAVRRNGQLIGSAQTGSQGEYSIRVDALQLGDLVDVAAYADGYSGFTHHGIFNETQEEVSFLDFRDVGNDQGDRRLPVDDGGYPPLLIMDELMPEPLTVTAAAGPNGSLTPVTQTCRYGQDVTIDISAAAGYHVDQITVDGVLAPVSDPFVLRDVHVSHNVEATFSNVSNATGVVTGWNLIAGDAGSDTHGVMLFTYGGAYYSLSADMMNAGEGYWGRFPSADTLGLACSGMPIPIHLEVGWNLIGNSGHDTAALPLGISAFVYAGGYTSTTTLAPGEGAWVKSETVQDIVLTPVP